MARPKAADLFRLTVDREDYEAAALLILFGALEVLRDPEVATQPAAARAAILQTFALNQLQLPPLRA
jgi:hypothetical protein